MKEAEAVIMATGYYYPVPGFISLIRHLIQWNDKVQYAVNKNYSIDSHHTLFVQNADLHTHGFNSADLGLGPYRNAIILNSILQYEHFQMELGVTFQKFGIPDASE